MLQIVPETSILDPIPTKLVYKDLEVLPLTITNILNKSLASGTVPSDFKTAVVRPLLKTPSLDPIELKNYRPISNLPFLSKLLKKLVLQQPASRLSTTIYSASISLLTGPGTARRLFSLKYSTTFSLPSMMTKVLSFCFCISPQLSIQ